MPHISKDWDKALGMAQTLEEKLMAEAIAAKEPVYLGEATYRREEVEELCRLNLNFLAALAMPTVFEYLFPRILMAAWQLLLQSVDLVRSFPQIALGIPRGHAKTTLIKLFILYCILFTQKKFILVIGSTAANAENIIADVIDMLSENNILQVFGDWRLGVEINRQDLRKFTFRKRTLILAAIGAEGSLRGLNIKNQRPDVMVFDDVQTRECADSKVQSEALERWIIGTAMKAKSPHGCIFIFAGNMYPTPNSILKKFRSNATWTKFISGAILADGTALWEELRPLQALIDELNNDISMGHPEIFFSEVLNDTDAGVNNKIDFALIKDWPYHSDDRPQGKFLIIDPAQGKAGGDNVTIGYCEVFDETPCLRKLIEGNYSPGNTIRRALLLALQTGTRVIGVESTSYQYTLLYWFDQVAKELNLTGFHFVELYSTSYSKNSRITDMLKMLTSGDILVHLDVRSQITHQIANWNPLKRDNDDGILDILAYMPKMLELYGPILATDDTVMVIEGQSLGVLQANHAF